MKRTYSYILAGAVAVAMAACSDKDKVKYDDLTPDTSSTTESEVTISTATIQTKKAVLEFKSDDKMSVFAKSGRLLSSSNIVDDIVATNDGSKWTLEPKVILNESQTTAYIYAVSPYAVEYTDIQKIPVDLSKQVDLMYSGSFVAASVSSPSVRLTMKHALSLLSFNIAAVNYSGAGKVTSIAVDGDIFYTAATMDASTGEITDLKANNTAITKDISTTVQSNGWNTDVPGIWALPFNTKTGDVTLTATIDGKEYKAIIPEVEVNQGWQYIFRLALTNNGLEFDPTRTETISLNVVTDNDVQFNGYGSITLTASGASLTTPLLSGDGVFGTLATPSGSQAYSSSMTIDGLSSGAEVTLESWNSDGFKIDNIEGIGTIDISQYE